MFYHLCLHTTASLRTPTHTNANTRETQTPSTTNTQTELKKDIYIIMIDDTPRWIGSDSQFGYSPFQNRIKFSTVSETAVNNYTLSNEYFTRHWSVHMFNSSTSAIMQLMVSKGIHLGDAGGYGSRDEIGYFEAFSDYGKAKKKRTAMLTHSDGYISSLKKMEMQQQYVENVTKYIQQESAKRDIKFIIMSTFMAYSCNCVTGGTLYAIKQVCDEIGALLIMDETLGSLRLGPLCSFSHAPDFKPHGFILGSKTFGCASLWVQPSLKKQFNQVLPNRSGSHILRRDLSLFEEIVTYICSLNIEKQIQDAEKARRFFGYEGGGLFWWVQTESTSTLRSQFQDYKFKRRILVPLDFNFSTLLKDIKREEKKKAKKEAKKRKRKEKRRNNQQKRRRKKREREAKQPTVNMFDVPADVLNEFKRIRAPSGFGITGSLLTNNGTTGRFMSRRLNRLQASAQKIVNMQMKGSTALHPIQLWNDRLHSPNAQALHTDGAGSFLIPIDESGRTLDFLAISAVKELTRLRIHVPYGKGIYFSKSVFHGGAPGRVGLEDCAVHFNVNESGNNEEFQKLFLRKFENWQAATYFPDGVIKLNGRLDKETFLEIGCLSVDTFKNNMIGWYQNCCEWDGHPLGPDEVFNIGNYEKYIE